MAATRGSSAFRTAQPSASSASTNSPLACAMPSTEPNSPTWAWPTLRTAPMSGGVIAVSQATWPMPRAPISLTRKRVPASTRHAVSGAPISLLNEPGGATVGPAAPSTWAMRSLVEVLPEEPVTPTTTSPRSPARRPRRRGPGATGRPRCRPRRPAAGRRPPRGRRARRPAPAAAAFATKSWPSTRSPASATNTEPGVTWRESMTTSGPRRRPAGRRPARPPPASVGERGEGDAVPCQSSQVARGSPRRRRTG